MKKAIVTGAYGFAGANLVRELLDDNYMVYAVGRKKSSHNQRFQESSELKKICLDMSEFGKLSELVEVSEGDEVTVFHLAWGGARDDFEAQYKNVEASLSLMEAAGKLGARFVGIGSQAEYGVKNCIITEDLLPEPFTAYGAAKIAAFYLLKRRAQQLGVHFVWGRIFSLIGKYEPEGRMIPELMANLQSDQVTNLSSCEQYWDYLDAADAARAIVLLGEKGRDGEAYNIAYGSYRPLRDFCIKAAEIAGKDESLLKFGNRPEPFVSLKTSIDKLKADTGFEPKISFEETIRRYYLNV
ncbi:NAD-dependent epimerase/dehydratase family protein [Butyrivibrio proteoclasticus]|uniref:NAD-dependent epimerase/dehydratase family protein n=1 Tax=Butyrivibrio proteoclasticus TaxID=43305 RepID=UPI00047EC35D|nr:NAD(P)-dependent oxidoreductase [Butyrivibrio proteoclasticus]